MSKYQLVDPERKSEQQAFGSKDLTHMHRDLNVK